MKRLFYLLSAVLALVLIAGCAQPAPSPAPAPSPKPSPTSPAATSPAPAPTAKPQADVWPRVVNIGSNSAGSGTYTMAVAMFKVIEAATGRKASPAPYATTSAFAPALEGKKLDFAIAGSPNFRWAIQGQTADKKPLTSIRTTTVGSPAPYILAVRPDSGIKTLADIKGKTIIGKQVGSAMVAAAWPALLAAAGLTEKDVTFLPFGSTTEITDAINEKRAHGEVWWTRSSSTYVQELATAGEITFISLTDEEVKRAIAKDPTFVPVVMPAGLFKGQDKPVKSFGFYTDIATRATLADEVVYAVTAAMHERFKELVGYSSEFQDFALPDSAAPDKLSIPVHNGAVKYLKEKGFWKKAHDDRQTQLLKELKLQ